MEVLWSLEQGTVHDVTDALSVGGPIAYTTVLTMLRILQKKGYVDARKEGRAHIYAPLVTRDAVRTSALKQLLKRFFDDSPEVLAQHLIQEIDIDARELDRLSAEVAKARTRRTGR